MSSEILAKKRMGWLDIAKTIAMVTVVTVHSTKEFSLPMLVCVSFCMQIFAASAGVTIKKIDWKDIPKATWRDCKQLFIPYSVCYVVMQFLLGYTGREEALPFYKYLLGIFTDDNPGMIWFLSALFWGRLIYRVLLHIPSEWGRIISVIVCTIIGMVLGNNFNVILRIDVALVCLLFIEEGYQIGRLTKAIPGVLNKPKWYYAVVFVGIVIWTIIVPGMQSTTSFASIGARYNPFPGFLAAPVILPAMFLLAEALEKVKYVGSFMEWFGRNTYTFFFIHFFDEFWIMKITPGFLDRSVLWAIYRLCVDGAIFLGIMGVKYLWNAKIAGRMASSK